MSLNFDTKNIADRSFCLRPGDPERMGERADEEYYTAELESVVMWSYVLDMQAIRNEADARKWYDRYVRWMLALGESDPKTWYTKPEHVRKAIGLTTNVFQTTDAAFAKKIRARTEETAAKLTRKAFEALDAPADA